MYFDSCSSWTPTYHLSLVCQALHQNVIAGSAHGFLGSLEEEFTEFHLANETQISSILNVQHEPPEVVEFVLVWYKHDSQCRSEIIATVPAALH